MPIFVTRQLFASKILVLGLFVSASAAFSLCFMPIACADGVSDQLLAAAKQITGTNRDNTCLAIDDFSGVANSYRPRVVRADNSGDPATHYSASTQGAYLGDAPAGAQPTPFLQALIDAGTVTSVPLNSVQMTEKPVPTYIPQLRDLMGAPAPSAPAAPSAPEVTPVDSVQGQAFIVTGPDARLFAPVPSSLWSNAPDPPALQPGTPGENPEPPSRVWRTNRICYSIKADRVLEYGNFQDDGNGTTEMEAFVLFHPTYMPSWISDYRVTAALHPEMLPNDVRTVHFRNDGNGWRVFQLGGGGTIRTDLHIVGGD